MLLGTLEHSKVVVSLLDILGCQPFHLQQNERVHRSRNFLSVFLGMHEQVGDNGGYLHPGLLATNEQNQNQVPTLGAKAMAHASLGVSMSQHVVADSIKEIHW